MDNPTRISSLKRIALLKNHVKIKIETSLDSIFTNGPPTFAVSTALFDNLLRPRNPNVIFSINGKIKLPKSPTILIILHNSGNIISERHTLRGRVLEHLLLGANAGAPEFRGNGKVPNAQKQNKREDIRSRLHAIHIDIFTTLFLL